MQAEQEYQRVIRDGNSANDQEQAEAQAQKDGKQFFHDIGNQAIYAGLPRGAALRVPAT